MNGTAREISETCPSKNIVLGSYVMSLSMLVQDSTLYDICVGSMGTVTSRRVLNVSYSLQIFIFLFDVDVVVTQIIMFLQMVFSATPYLPTSPLMNLMFRIPA